ncbi:hypothetical protein KIW84_MT0029 (mitochondrion) [Lathyrus oleraceus]|nr:hypothetical protein KIW84_MT0029 [Pisum sativum]
MTPSPLDRKTKANEAEPRWRDRLVLTRLIAILSLRDPEWSKQLGVTRKPPGWGSLNRRSGALFTALYLKQCAVTLQQAYGGITPYDIHTKLSVPVSLTRSVRDWLRGLIRKLANRYLYQALSRPPPLPGNLVGTDLEGSANGSNDAEAYIERISSLFYGHPLPPRDEWDDWLSNISANSSVTIQKCILMEFDSTGDLFCYPGGLVLAFKPIRRKPFSPSQLIRRDADSRTRTHVAPSQRPDSQAGVLKLLLSFSVSTNYLLVLRIRKKGNQISSLEFFALGSLGSSVHCRKAFMEQEPIFR